MDKASKAVFDANAQCCDIMNRLIKEETMEGTIKMNPLEMSGARCIIPIPKGYEFAGVDDDKQQVVFEKIGYQYPKTYVECCDVLGVNPSFDIKMIEEEESALYFHFIDLLRCRNAYRKIAGEQMGLGRPWEPDFTNDKPKYCLYVDEDVIECDTVFYINHILSFPTVEMRDVFYENFKDLIEQCKELL